jgi:tetratricopeptide (TPR) repeat protein
MKPSRKSLLLVLITFVTFCSCDGQKRKINPLAKKLNDSAMNIYRMSSKLLDTGVLKHAVNLLNKATGIDSDYFTAYRNKLLFQIQLRNDEPALKTGKELLRLKPDDVEVIVITGQCYDRMGDSLSASLYYKMALSKFDKILDTMNVATDAYKTIALGKALDLILLNRRKESTILLNQLSAMETDTIYKNRYKEFTNFSKSDILYGPKMNVVSEDANPVKH